MAHPPQGEKLMIQHRYFTLALLALAFFVTSHNTLANPPADKTISIAEARSLPLGTVVTIDGSVTVASGAFSSSTFDQGFAIQDRTGGIYVSTPDNLGLAPRQQVRVTGTLADTLLPGLLVLVDVTDVKAHGSGGPKVQSLPVDTGDVGEGTEGKIVRITGTITQPIVNDLPFGFIIVVNDGSGEINVFVCASTGIDVSGLSPGQTIEVTGFSGQFADHFEVDPRTQSDIRIVN
jgi:DNA/RNA endonuclease YhcR with UshA esterase domain